MKKYLFKAATVLACVVLIAVIFGKGAAAILDERVNHALSSLGARYGVALTYDKVSFVSLSGVTILGLKAVPQEIADSDARPFLRAGTTKIHVDLHAFITGKPCIDLIEASDVALTLRRDADGVWDLSRIRSHARPRSDGGGSTVIWPLKLSLDGFLITVDVAGDSATKFISNVECLVDPPQRNIKTVLSSGSERLNVTAALAAKEDADDGAGHSRSEIPPHDPAHDHPAIHVDFSSESFGLSIAEPLAGRIVDFTAVHVTAAGAAEIISPQEFSFKAQGSLSDVTIHHSLLARNAADGIAFGFGVNLLAKNKIFLLKESFLSLGGESVIIDGRCSGMAHPAIDFSVHFPPLHIGPVVSSIPRSLLPHLTQLAARGTVNGDFSFNIDLARPRSLAYGYKGRVDSFAILSLGPDVDVSAKKKPFLYVAHLPDGETRSVFVGPANPDFVPLARIPRTVIGAVLTAEDGSFYSHGGFSVHHIGDALVENLEAGHVVRGASTLTMQLAKNLYLSRERTLSRKVEEAVITLALEQELDKKRILEIYLNIIEWGPHVFGIGPASRYYFDKPAEALDPIESAFLASIIARPNHGWGREPLERLSGWWSYLRDILTKMYRRGDVTLDTLREAGVSDTKIQSLIDEDSMAMLSSPDIPPGFDDEDAGLSKNK